MSRPQLQAFQTANAEGDVPVLPPSHDCVYQWIGRLLQDNERGLMT